MEHNDIYELDDLIENLEKIKEKGDGVLNFPKAFYCLALELKEIKYYLKCLHMVLPSNIKKFDPKPNENPFFAKEFTIPTDKKELDEAKKRMTKPNSSEVSLIP